MNKQVEAVVPEELYQVIVGATSQDPHLVMSSTNRLKQMVDMFGTFDCLSTIACQRSLSLNIRQQSIIQFKNVAMSHWKARRLISEEQKNSIRLRTMSLLDERDDTIAECNKYIIAKIARQDFPAAWPNLIGDLSLSIENSLKVFVDSGGSDDTGALVCRRSLEIMNAILKELGSVRMPNGLKIMAKLVEILHQTLENCYATLSSIMVSVLNVESISLASTASAITLSHLAYKCICKMALWTWNRLTLKSFMELLPWVEAFFYSSATQLKVLFESRIAITSTLQSRGSQPSDPLGIRSLDYLARHVRQYGKLFRRMQQLTKDNFVSMQAKSELVLYYWSKVVQATNSPSNYIADSPCAVFPVWFLVQAMSLFKDSLGRWNLKKSATNGIPALTQEFVEEAVKLLVTRFLPLNSKDLNNWSTDPEEWMITEDKDSEQWEYELRPCGERVLVTLANQYEIYVVPLVQAIFANIALSKANNLDEIVQKEAVYCAIGRCAAYLEGKIPLQDWISQNLLTEAKETNPDFPILKRRIAWVLGKLVSEESIIPDDRIWSILLHLLNDHNTGSDLVVRFTAAVALGECVDSLSFKIDDFELYLPSTLSSLINMTAEVDSLEAKRKVTQSLNLIILKSEERIIPYMEIIANEIPAMWVSADNDFLYKAVLLETVHRLIEASKGKSITLNKITIPLLKQSLSDESRASLDQDAIALWTAALRNASAFANSDTEPSLLELLPISVELLGSNLDLLGSITSIIESYFVLDAVTVIQVVGESLFQAFLRALETAVQTNQKDVLRVLRTMAQLCPAAAWAEPLHRANLFAYFIKTLDEDKVNVLLLTEYILLFARMALNDPLVLTQLITATAPILQKAEKDIWEALLDQWWRRFDNMHEPRQRKLVAMGIACLVATGQPDVLRRLSGEIFNLWLDVFGEMKEALNDISQHGTEESTLSRLITFWRDNGSVLPSELDEIEGTPEYERWVKIFSNDPVERVKLTTFVAEKLQTAQQVYGSGFHTTFLQDTDPTVLSQLQKELTT